MKCLNTSHLTIKKDLKVSSKDLEETRSSLQTSLKANEDLSNKLKITMDVHSRCEVVKKSQKAKLVELEANTKKFEENVGIKPNLHDMTLSYHTEQLRIGDLKKEVEGCQKEIEDSKREVHRLKRYILKQHELDFTKALNQAAFFYQIPTNDERFDVGKDFYRGELMSISEIPLEESNNVGNAKEVDPSHTTMSEESAAQPKEQVE